MIMDETVAFQHGPDVTLATIDKRARLVSNNLEENQCWSWADLARASTS